METPVFPSEGENRVIRAVSSVVPLEEEDDVRVEGGLLRVRVEGYERLLKLRESLRRNRVLDTARDLLIRSRRGGSFEISVHKQAAFWGTIKLCEDDSESPLGAIRVRIQYPGDPDVFLNWIAPRTRRGRAVREVSTRQLVRDLSSEVYRQEVPCHHRVGED